MRAKLGLRKELPEASDSARSGVASRVVLLRACCFGASAFRRLRPYQSCVYSVPDMGSQDPELVRSLMVVMRVTGADFTHSFRRLSVVAPPGAGATEAEVQQADALFLMEVLEGCATPKEIAESVRPKVAPEQLKARPDAPSRRRWPAQLLAERFPQSFERSFLRLARLIAPFSPSLSPGGCPPCAVRRSSFRSQTSSPRCSHAWACPASSSSRRWSAWCASGS